MTRALWTGVMRLNAKHGSRRYAALAIWCLISPTPSLAVSFLGFDARSTASGGTGVASARPAMAPMFNPALLSSGFDDDTAPWSLNVSIGGRLSDRGGFVSGVRHYQDNDADVRFEAALSRFNRDVENLSLSTESFRRLSGASEDLFDDIDGFSDRPLRLGGSFSATLSKPGPTGMAGFVRTYLVGGGLIDFDSADRELVGAVLDFGSEIVGLQSNIEPYRTFLAQNAPSLQVAYDAGGFAFLEDEARNLLSTSDLSADAEPLISLLRAYHKVYETGSIEIDDVELLSRLPETGGGFRTALELEGAFAAEAGISLAKPLGDTRGISAGLTVKFVEFQAFDYRETLADATRANFEVRQHRTVSTGLNLDIGLAGSLSENLRWGVVIRNLIARDYETVRGNRVELRPQARMGVAWSRDDWTATADVDLTRNEPLGFDPDKRFLGLGLERRWSRWVLRGGLRHNLVDHFDLYSVGIAVLFGSSRLELSGAGASDAAAFALDYEIQF